jgi:hypothetical protein
MALKLGYFGKYIRYTLEVRNVVLEKDGEDQLDQPCEKWRSITKNLGGDEYPIYNKNKEGYLGWCHILRRICLLNHVISVKIEGKIGVTGKRGRRYKRLLDDLTEMRNYCTLKEGALDPTRWSIVWKRLWSRRKTDYRTNEQMTFLRYAIWMTEVT